MKIFIVVLDDSALYGFGGEGFFVKAFAKETEAEAFKDEKNKEDTRYSYRVEPHMLY